MSIKAANVSLPRWVKSRGGFGQANCPKTLGVVYIYQMSRLSSANASRCNGSTSGFGYLSGSLPNDGLTAAEITSRHAVIKEANHCALRGDWDTYQALMATLWLTYPLTYSFTLMQLSLFTVDAKNKIVPFHREPIEEWMINLCDYVTDAMTPTQWNRAMEAMFKRYL